jgi:tetratricopeptide (TPR) repeat protein
MRAVRPFLQIGALLLALMVGACVSKPESPYAGTAESERNPAEAERLTKEGVAAIDSEPARAEELFRRALAADLYHAPAHNNLGTLLLRRGRLYEAAGEFEWAKRLLPGHPDPRLNLALTLEKAGRVDEAIAGYRTALEAYPEHIQSMQGLARLQVRSGRTDEHSEHLLSEIALRGETEVWRDWARLQMTKTTR